MTFDSKQRKEVNLRKTSLDKSKAGTLCDSPTDSKFTLSDLSFDFDIELQCDKISIAQILKAAGIRIVSDYDKLTERLYSYIQMVREFDGDKVFVFVNLRSFVRTGELQDFADTVLAHGYRILLIDNFAYPKLTGERRLIVDEDLCEL